MKRLPWLCKNGIVAPVIPTKTTASSKAHQAALTTIGTVKLRVLNHRQDSINSIGISKAVMQSLLGWEWIAVEATSMMVCRRCGAPPMGAVELMAGD
jgi:hypothetical protein